VGPLYADSLRKFLSWQVPSISDMACRPAHNAHPAYRHWIRPHAAHWLRVRQPETNRPEKQAHPDRSLHGRCCSPIAKWYNMRKFPFHGGMCPLMAGQCKFSEQCDIDQAWGKHLQNGRQVRADKVGSHQTQILQ